MDCIVHGVAMSQTQLSNFLYWLLTHTHTHTHTYTHELHYCRDVGLVTCLFLCCYCTHTHTHTHTRAPLLQR